ncbi:hypothetical protein [Altererythrobacter sp. ZODW24]|uniref:hypothetical protein n=1 Tax=Altererythrobacter sp. ZODW24 TaxID=2185142 RepID=UPI0013B382B6|nr:hypothetical protein [Altererythrobacter sp. ZODW24]
MLAAAAITPILARYTAAMAASGHFAPETGRAMTFTRTLERGLSDGAAIVVQRNYLVSFAEVGSGFAVTGQQNDVTVSAPPALSSLVAIEQSRVDTKSFPLQLGANGWIMGAKAEVDQAATNEAVAQAIALIRESDLSQSEAAQARAFLANIQKAASEASSMPPADLFCPPEAKRVDRQALTLPNGLEGQIEITFTGEKSPETGLMRSAERNIITSLDGSSRHSCERWSLALQDR